MGLMGMLGSLVDLQLLELCTSETIFRQHATDGSLDEALRVRVPDLARTRLTNTARIARVAEIRFVLLFVARQDDFLGVDDDDVILERRRARGRRGRVDRPDVLLAGPAGDGALRAVGAGQSAGRLFFAERGGANRETAESLLCPLRNGAFSEPARVWPA